MEASDIVRTSSVRMDDKNLLVFYTYTLRGRRLGGCRVHAHKASYSGPTKNGFDMTLEQLDQLTRVLEALSRALADGEIAPPVEFARIAGGRGAEWVVQVFDGGDTSDELLLDIRKFVTTERYSGFTRKALRIGTAWLGPILTGLPGVRESIQAYRRGEWGLFAEPPAEDELDADPPTDLDAVPDEYRRFF